MYTKDEYYFSSQQLIVNDLHNPFEACQIRAKVYANACIYVLLNSQNKKYYLFEVIKETALQFSRKLEIANNKYKQFNFKLGRYTLVKELQQLLSQFQTIAGISLKDILLGEAFWQWQVFEPLVLSSISSVHISNNQFIEVLQKDTPQTYPLSSEQLIQWQQIFESRKPQWFLDLPNWAQHALLNAGDGLRRVMPITYRGLPGLANTTIHEFQINMSKYGPQQTYRLAVPVPYLMNNRQERLESTLGNIQQILNYWLQQEKLSDAMQNYWGYTHDSLLGKSIKKPLLVLSLLTGKGQSSILGKILDIFGFSINNNNSVLVDESNQSYLSFFNKYPEYEKNYEVFIQEVGINYFRSAQPTYVNPNFLGFLEDFVQDIQKYQNEISIENTTKIHALQEILRTIKAHRVLNDSELTQGRNKNLYLAALYDVAVRLTGGVSIGNCKSSKDRKGIELLYADAMLVFYHAHGVFPAYADQENARRDFLIICKALFDSGHILKVINQNLVGCPGLKDEEIMDSDLQDFLGDHYKMAKLISNFSEPVTFLEKYRQVIFKTILVLAITESGFLGLSWLCHWLPTLNLPIVLLDSPVLTSFLTLIMINLMVGGLLMMMLDYVNFIQKGKSLDEIILASENNAQSYDKYQKLACIS